MKGAKNMKKNVKIVVAAVAIVGGTLAMNASNKNSKY